MGTPVDRRTFLAALGLGGAAVVVGCSGSDPERSDGAAADTTTSDPGPKVETPTPGLTADPFGLGVCSGDPTDRSVILWTRLVTDRDRPVPIRWEVATDEEFTDVVGAGIIEADPRWGYSVHLDATGLRANTEYFFRFSVDEFVSPVGRTRTAPAPDAEVDELRFAFASCQNWAHGYYTAHDAIAADRLDAVFFLGDFIYESSGAADAVRPFEADEPMDLAGYRDRYAMYLSDEKLRASRASAPWIVTWDDHEVENNTAGNVSQDGITGDEFAARRLAAYQAFYEHQPVRLPGPESLPWAIHRAVRWGSLAEFLVLDGRQYRDDQPCGDEALTSTARCEAFAEDRTMLGADQERWVIDGITGSDATWKVLAQQTVMTSLVIGDVVLNVDQWDGYPQARERLLGAIRDAGVDNVVVLTGDIHAAGAATLHAGPPDNRVPVATEFVGTSISSNGLIDKFPGAEAALRLVEFEDVKYLNVVDHGYCRCTVTARSWTTEFVVVDTKVPEATPRVDAFAKVSAGGLDLTVS